ncbi:MAG: hypothetical protein U0223_16865 [Nitrospira sp.]
MSNVSFYEPKDDSINRKATAEELANVPRMSRKEMTEVLRSEDYKRSKLAQELVRASIAKGLLSEPGEEPVNAGHLSGDDLAAKHHAYRSMFTSPRYKTDPSYRREVAEKLRELTANDQPLEDNAIMTPNKTVRVSLSPFAHEAAKVESLGVHRAESRTTDHIGPEPKQAKPAGEYFSD